jgi:hypothetical protein
MGSYTVSQSKLAVPMLADTEESGEFGGSRAFLLREDASNYAKATKQCKSPSDFSSPPELTFCTAATCAGVPVLA